MYETQFSFPTEQPGLVRLKAQTHHVHIRLIDPPIIFKVDEKPLSPFLLPLLLRGQQSHGHLKPLIKPPIQRNEVPALCGLPPGLYFSAIEVASASVRHVSPVLSSRLSPPSVTRRHPTDELISLKLAYVRPSLAATGLFDP